MTRNDLLVSADEAGVRIDRYLTSVLVGQSRSQIQRLIKDGRVTAASGEEFSRAGTTLSTREGETTLIEGNAAQLAKCKPENK